MYSIQSGLQPLRRFTRRLENRQRGECGPGAPAAGLRFGPRQRSPVAQAASQRPYKTVNSIPMGKYPLMLPQSRAVTMTRLCGIFAVSVLDSVDNIQANTTSQIAKQRI